MARYFNVLRAKFGEIGMALHPASHCLGLQVASFIKMAESSIYAGFGSVFALICNLATHLATHLQCGKTLGCDGIASYRNRHCSVFPRVKRASMLSAVMPLALAPIFTSSRSPESTSR